MRKLKLLGIPFIRDLLGEHPIVVADVGASGGMNWMWGSLNAPLHYVGFEPDSAEHEKLVARADPKKETYLNMGLAGVQGVVEFHVTRMQACSSMLEPNCEFVAPFRPKDFEVVKTIRVPVDTLDHQLETAQVPQVDFLKLDTQGTELDILSGATRTLAGAFAIDIELEFQPLYRKQPLFGEVDEFLRAQGFECFDLFSRYWKRAAGKRYGSHKGQIIFAEGIYLRSAAASRSLAEGPPRSAKAKICKALIICSLHGYLDYAFDLLLPFRQLFTTDELEQVDRAFARDTPWTRKLPNFWGKRRLAKLFLELHYACRF